MVDNAVHAFIEWNKETSRDFLFRGVMCTKNLDSYLLVVVASGAYVNVNDGIFTFVGGNRTWAM